MAVKKLTYVIEVDTESGKVKIDGLTRGFINAETAASKLRKTIVETNNAMGQGASKTGLAGAALTELGRTISDSNYGMMAMANNLQQLATLFITLSATSGGFTNGLKLIWAAFKGPLGLIVIFQSVIALIEKFSIKNKETADSLADVNKELRELGRESERLLRNNAYQQTIFGDDPAKVKELRIERKKILEDRLEELKILQRQKVVLLEMAEAAAGTRTFFEAVSDTVKEKNYNYLVGLGAAIQVGFRELIKPYASLGEFVSKGLKIDQKDIVPQKAETEAIKNAKAEVDAVGDEILKVQAEIQKLTNGGDGPKDKLRKAKIYSEPDVSATVQRLFGMTPEQFQQVGDSALQAMAKFVNDEAILSAQRTANENQQVRARIELAGKEAAVRLENMALIGQGLEDLGALVGRQTAAGKLIASAGALIDTYAAVNKALAQPGLLPGTRIPYAISVGLFGLARVAAINRVKVPNSGGGGGGGGQAANLTTTQAPTFNIVGSSNASQLRDAVEGQLNRPVKAYVTTKDIRSNEELDRNTRRGATIG